MPAPVTVAPAAVDVDAQRAVRRDDLVAGRDQFADPVVGGVAAAPGGVHDPHRAVVALGQVGLRHVEHQHQRLAEALQPAEQPAHRRRAVAPPAVGGRAHHVVAVDEQHGHRPYGSDVASRHGRSRVHRCGRRPRDAVRRRRRGRPRRHRRAGPRPRRRRHAGDRHRRLDRRGGHARRARARRPRQGGARGDPGRRADRRRHRCAVRPPGRPPDGRGRGRRRRRRARAVPAARRRSGPLLPGGRARRPARCRCSATTSR